MFPVFKSAQSMIPLDVPGLSIHETMGGDQTHRDAMLQLYAELFPEYAYYLPYMAYKMTQPIDGDPLFIERWWLIEIEGRNAALNYIKYAPERNCGFLLSIGILPQYRSYRVGKYPRLLDFIVDISNQQLKADAAMLGRPIPMGMVAEFQRPELDMTQADQDWYQHVINRFSDIGYLDLGIDYYEPPHIFGQESYLQGVDPASLDYHRMLLSILPLEGGQFDLHNPHRVRECALAVLVDHYKLPETHWAVQAALNSIEVVPGI
jgi:hypothetical protein